MSQKVIEQEKISKLLGMYRKRIERLEQKNTEIMDVLIHPNKIAPMFSDGEINGWRFEYNRNEETIRTLIGVIENLEDIIIGEL